MGARWKLVLNGCARCDSNWRERTIGQRICVLQDATLLEIARSQPRTMRELMEIKGMGPKRAEKYGKELLAELAKEYNSALLQRDITEGSSAAALHFAIYPDQAHALAYPCQVLREPG